LRPLTGSVGSITNRTHSLIRVEYQLGRDGDRTPLKTEESRRAIDIPPQLMRRLVALVAERGTVFDPAALVFASRTGSGLERKVAREALKRAVKAAGIAAPEPSLHDLRHSHASMLIALDVPLVDVQRRLGHRKPDTTLRVYAHQWKEREAPPQPGRPPARPAVRGAQATARPVGDTAGASPGEHRPARLKGGAMTVQELIAELERCDGEAEVRFLAQPSWPFEYTIAAVVEATDQPTDLIYALKLLLTDGDVTRIEFEADDAGNVDDLIVHRAGQPALYHQIKFVVAQQQPLTHDWFTTPPKRSRRSPLQRFHESYAKLTSAKGVAPEMAPHEPAASARRPAAEARLGNRLQARPSAGCQDAQIRRRQGAYAMGRASRHHRGTTPLLPQPPRDPVWPGGLDDLRERCAWAMRAVGFRSDVASVLAAIGALRALIRTGVRELNAESVQRVAITLQLLAGNPRATLLVQSLRSDPWPETATASVDWVDLFVGDDAASRRQLKEPSGWNGRLKSELAAAVEQIRRARLTDVDIRGTMRLGTGLLVGVQLSEVAGFKVAAIGREGEWTSSATRHATTVDLDRVKIDQGDDLGIAIAVSQPIRDDVVSYLRTENLPVGELIVYSRPGGASREAVSNPEAGMSLAVAISRRLREDTSSHRHGVHLFQAGPLPLAIMIGHLWNRMPRTQVYDDLGPGSGYTATYTI
jgi:SMODS-associated and fused to various effectors sensor domain/Phage integrase family